MTQSSQNLRIYIGQLTLSAWVEWKQILKLHKHLFPFHRAPSNIQVDRLIFALLLPTLCQIGQIAQCWHYPCPALLPQRNHWFEINFYWSVVILVCLFFFFFFFFGDGHVSHVPHIELTLDSFMTWVELSLENGKLFVDHCERLTDCWHWKEIGCFELKKILIAVLRWDFLSNGHHSWSSHIENQ